MNRKVLVTLLVLMLSASSDAASPLTLSACVGQTITNRHAQCARVGLAPTTVLVRVRVEPDPENRGLSLRTSNETLRSDLEIEGADSAPLYLREWRIDEDGEFKVAAYLVTTRGIVAVETQTVTVR